MVVELADDTQIHRLALGGRHLRQRPPETRLAIVAVDEARNRPCRLVVELGHGKSQPLDCAQLHAPTPKVARQLLARDPIQPGIAGRTGVAEATAPLERDRERLGKQVSRNLGVKHPPIEVASNGSAQRS